jgi:hypothetical protein
LQKVRILHRLEQSVRLGSAILSRGIDGGETGHDRLAGRRLRLVKVVNVVNVFWLYGRGERPCSQHGLEHL